MGILGVVFGGEWLMGMAVDGKKANLEKPVSYCSVCKRRPAVYFRVFSGDRLCLSCLRRQLVRGVKRSVGRTGVFKPRSKIMVPLSLIDPLASLGLADIMARLERDYGSMVVLAVLSDQIRDVRGIEELRKLGVKVEEFNVDIDKYPIHMLDCIRFERGIYIRIGAMLGVDAIASPLSRTQLALAALDALLSGNPMYWSESLDYISSKPPVVAAFSLVEAEAVAAYAVLSGYRGESLCRAKFRSKRVFYSISGRRPELEYSSSKTIEVLSTAASRMLRRCTICYGYSSSDTCMVCNYMGTGALNIVKKA